MKYTIEGFSQDKLLELGLDHTDALILRWFSDFASSGAMLKTVQAGTVYYQVRYEGIIRDLPILGITSTKGIAKRFEKYVAAGLMTKITRRGGNTYGAVTLFSFTKQVTTLTYRTETDRNGNGSRPEKHQKPEEAVHTVPDGYSGSRRKNDNADGNCGIRRDVPTDTQVPAATATTVPAGLNNSSTRNSSTAAERKDTGAEDGKQAAALKKAVSRYFDPAVFSPDFFQSLTKAAGTISADKMEDYIDWAYRKCTAKKPENLSWYFYKTVSQPYFVSAYLSERKAGRAVPEKNVKPALYVCPVCGNVHAYFTDCPDCGLEWELIRFPDEIDIRKKIYALPQDKKSVLKKELYGLTIEFGRKPDPSAWTRRKKEIYRKYISIAD